MSPRRIPIVVALVVGLATALACVAGFHADRNDQRSRERAMSVQATRAIENATAGLQNRVSDVAGLFEASQSVTAREFQIYGRPVLASSKASGLGFARVISDSQRAAYERTHDVKITAIAPDGSLSTAPRSATYLVSEYGLSSHGTKPIRGINLMADPVRRRALITAAAAGRPIATPPIRLARTRKLGFAMYMPVYGAELGGAVTTGVVGYTIGSFRFDDLSRQIADALPKGTALRLAYRGDGVVRFGDLEGDVTTSAVDVGGLKYTVAVAVPGGSGLPLGALALIVGAILTLLLTALTLVLVRAARNDRRLAESLERERDLAVSNEALGRAMAQERFHQIFDSAPSGMALIDLDGCHREVNSAYAAFAGRGRDDLVDQPLSTVLPEQEAEAMRSALADLAAGVKDVHETDQPFIRPDGEVAWAALRQTVLRGDDGAPELILTQIFDIDERRSLEQRLQHLADHDPLTGLANRRLFETIAAQHVAQTPRYGADGALLLLDLDRFKEVNDVHGHQLGDELLRDLAEGLRGALRDSDLAARLGGDEFGVVLARGDLAGVRTVADRILAVVREIGEKYAKGISAPPSGSIGIAMLEPGIGTVGQALERADRAMYEAKRAGGDRMLIDSHPHVV